MRPQRITHPRYGLVQTLYPPQWSNSPSISTGRSAWPSARIATSTAMSVPRSRKRASPARCAPNWRGRRRGSGGASCGSIFFGGGTPSLMDPATVADLIADATTAVRARPRPRNHAGSQSDQRRSRQAARLPRRRGQPRVARHPKPRSRRAPAARPRALRAASDRRAGTGTGDVPAGLVRPDLRATGPRHRRLARRAGPGARPRARTTSRYISSPSNPARSSRPCTAAASLPCPDDDTVRRAVRGNRRSAAPRTACAPMR